MSKQTTGMTANGGMPPGLFELAFQLPLVEQRYRGKIVMMSSLSAS